MVDRIALAARNNAEWCDAVTQSWGALGRFDAALWINPGAAPPFYPNAVTLAPIERAPAVLADAPVDFAVKDSFASLDLAPLGYEILFEAQWIWRDPQPATKYEGPDYRIVRDPDSLVRWEEAWRGEDAARDLFRPSLLRQPDHAFIAGEIGGRIVAGCVASRSEHVVGVSNLFGDADLQAGCIAAAQALAPALPLVGYEGGAALEAMKGLGFQALGPLLVWLRENR